MVRFAILRRVFGPTNLEVRLRASAPQRHSRVVRSLSRRERVPILFLAQDVSTWKCDSIYRAAEHHPRLDPVVVVHPRGGAYESLLSHDRTACNLFLHDRTADSFETMGYVVKRTLDRRGRLIGSGISGKGILVSTNPHSGITPTLFRPQLLLEHLPVYIPYMIGVYSSERLNFDLLTYHLAWRHYRATPWHHEQGLRKVPDSSRNSRFVGYSNRDRLVSALATTPRRSGAPVLLWAPHHSIEPGEYQISTFLEWHEVFLDMARSGREASVIFRPHPLLLGKLVQLWGLHRAQSYWVAWREALSGRISEAEHQAEVFAESDAIIHDSITFMGEWLLVGRPAAFLMRSDIDPRERLNDLGREFLRGHHLVHDAEDLEEFIKLIRCGADPLAATQQELAAAHLPSPRFGSVGQAVVQDICAGLGIPA